MTTWRENYPFIKDQNLLQINQNKQTKSKVYTMKLINTLAVIAATMVALPSTGAVKLKQDVEVEDLAKQLISVIFENFDHNDDGYLQRDEFEGMLEGMKVVYDAADMADGDEKDEVSAEAILKTIALHACVEQCE